MCAHLQLLTGVVQLAEWLPGQTAWLGFNMSSAPFMTGYRYPPGKCQVVPCCLYAPSLPAGALHIETGCCLGRH